MPQIQKHVHKLKRHHYKSTGSKIFFCVLPDCHFKTEVALCLGKKCICWRCNHEFIINEYSLRLARPHCDDCRKSKNAQPETGEIIKPISSASVDELKDRLSKTLNGQFAAKPDVEL